MNKSSAFKLLEFYGLSINHRGKWRVHDTLRNLLGVNPNHDFEVERDGLQWLLNPADCVERDLFWYGVKDLFEIFHIKSLIKPGDIIFDVGANFGYYSIKLAALLRRDCRIYALEPYPPTFRRLSHNISKNKFGDCIFPFELGISDAVGSTTMIPTAGNTGGTYVSRSAGEGSIKLQTLDYFCSEHNVNKIDFMKIDVEGLEPLVLKGAIPYFDKLNDLPIMLIEINPGCLKRADFCTDDILQPLKRYGYSLYVANRKELRPLTKLPEEGDLVNAFCIPKKI